MIYLGTNAETGKRFYVPPDSFETHWHIIGATGKGKTTAIEAILHQLFTARERRPISFSTAWGAFRVRFSDSFHRPIALNG